MVVPWHIVSAHILLFFFSSRLIQVFNFSALKPPFSQTILTEKFSSELALAICGIVFGLLHAVTPVYALLAGAASVFFGNLYNMSGNLAVPIICHAVYDVGALMWAHWSVTGLTAKEQDDILESGPGAPIMDAGLNSSGNDD
mmetsp:Transcript_3581/g.5594  ORF Transcript_3581/g.5594 Transcript_3581/m.5594 type:complete len:142 (+) Transcript_3581:40-465(+)